MKRLLTLTILTAPLLFACGGSEESSDGASEQNGSADQPGHAAGQHLPPDVKKALASGKIMPEGMEMPKGMPEGMKMPEGMPKGMEMPKGMPEGMEMPK